MLSILSSYVISPLSAGLQSIKKILVGELSWNDLYQFVKHKQIPTKADEFYRVEVLNSTWPDEKTNLLMGPNYGMLGYFLGLNFAILRPDQNSSRDILTFLRTVDSMPNSRQPLEEYERFTGMKLVLSTTGPAGLKLHQKFAATLPTRDYVIDTAIHLTQKKMHDMFERYPDLARDKVSKKIEIEILLKDILAHVMLGSKLTDDQMALLNAALAGDTRITEQYHTWVRATVSDVLLKQSRGGSALEKAIAQIENPDIEALVNDPTINALFTVLLTFMNLTRLIHGAIKRCTRQAGFEKQLTDEFARLSTASPVFDKNCLNAPLLKQFFKDALLATSFNPIFLPRLISQPIEYQNQKIPSGTLLFVKHLDAKAPFSYGERRCPGNRLVEYIFEAVVAVFVDSLSKKYSVDNACDRTQSVTENSFLMR